MEILNVNNPHQPPIICSFSVYIPAIHMTIHNMRLIKTKKGHTMVTYPSYSKEVAGERQWFKYIELSEEKRKEFEAKIFMWFKQHEPEYVR